jgi:general stress protein 26
MPTPQELTDKLFDGLKSDMTMMLGLDGVEDGHARPMTVQLDGDDRKHIYFFSSTENAIVQKLGSSAGRSIATYTSKGHDVFATIHGNISKTNDRALIDRLWNKYVAAWYKEGKDDPKLALLCLTADSAEIWEDASSMLAGIKALIGIDPKTDYKDKVAEVKL